MIVEHYLIMSINQIITGKGKIVFIVVILDAIIYMISKE